MIDYYPCFSNLLNISKKQGIEIEKKAMKKASKIIYSSHWASESAIKDFGIKKDKIYIIPFGANLEETPSKNEVEKMINDRLQERKVCRLLFIGVDWFRKGGDIAFKTTVELNKRGVPTKLIVCGCYPSFTTKSPYLKILGFLDKNEKEQSDILAEQYRKAHLFILPTRAEAAGIVFSEACAYGLPIISTFTGGVSTYVKDGVNGYLLSIESNYIKYADIIQKIWENIDEYYALSINARKMYEKELNWDIWGVKVKKIILSLL